jgi:hypothetical protein
MPGKPKFFIVPQKYRPGDVAEGDQRLFPPYLAEIREFFRLSSTLTVAR